MLSLLRNESGSININVICDGCQKPIHIIDDNYLIEKLKIYHKDCHDKESRKES